MAPTRPDRQHATARNGRAGAHHGGGFAVIDVETTGFRAGGGDRIVEIAVVQVDLLATGDAVAWPVEGHATGEEYVTLLDPQRDPGPTHVHGITDELLAGAPRFEHVAGDVMQLIAGRTIVAHNASFDLRFLAAEFEQAGHPLPAIGYVCTITMCRALGKPVPRNLASCCEHFGVPLGNAHSALDDARATARLFATCARSGCEPGVVERTFRATAGTRRWPRIPAAGIEPVVRVR